MGFSLRVFFMDLQRLLDTDMKPKKKIEEFEKMVAEAKKYAKECGQLE